MICYKHSISTIARCFDQCTSPFPSMSVESSQNIFKSPPSLFSSLLFLYYVCILVLDWKLKCLSIHTCSWFVASGIFSFMCQCEFCRWVAAALRGEDCVPLSHPFVLLLFWLFWLILLYIYHYLFTITIIISVWIMSVMEFFLCVELLSIVGFGMSLIECMIFWHIGLYDLVVKCPL